ncbi:hypothetical protein BJ912DRAFT_915513 [Pholiota molesta]|nr:hypothetical protein BJ912DRAFT_915513 [Pholiota molesta]
MTTSNSQCLYCLKILSSAADVRRHQEQDPLCKIRLQKARQQALKTAREKRRGPRPNLPAPENLSISTVMEEWDDILPDTSDPAEDPSDPDAISPPNVTDNPRQHRRTHQPEMVEVDDPDSPASQSQRKPWSQPCPSEYRAGQPVSATQGKTAFERIEDEQILKYGHVLGPFRDEEEWELAKWLIKNVGHTQADALLKLPIIANKAKPSFQNKKQLLDAIDGLPTGVPWKCHDIEVTGDQPDFDRDPSGQTCRKEHLELWYRDPVECVAELIGNPAFAKDMKFAPERFYEDREGRNQILNEMSTGSWWWDLQQLLPEGATISPVILSSDKTLLSNFRGDNSAWPLYLTIGNIPKETRRQVSAHATILLGYLPIPKFDCFSDKTRSLAKYRLFHYCLEKILMSLREAGLYGKDMMCADGWIRKIWPILAVYVADYPEQCLIACCMENRCPICLVEPNSRGNHTPAFLRSVRETLFFLKRKQQGEKDTAFKAWGLRDVPAPFWRNLPFCNIFTAFTPDLLHQVHKGVFKDHLVKWCTEILTDEIVDQLFRSAPSYHSLRHFKNGISNVSQWTGTEHKEMERIFLGLMASHRGTDTRVLQAVRAMTDFIHYASLETHTTQSLLALRQSLDNFHRVKEVFLELGGRQGGHFNIPKLHSLEHYDPLIQLFGSADGYNTESPERLHIDYAKNAFRASNRKDYISQMTRWLERQEAVDRFSQFLVWKAKRNGMDLDSSGDTGLSESDLQNSILISKSAYSMSKKPPPSSRHVPASLIMAADGYQAPHFLEALTVFLRKNGITSFTPYPHDTFGLWSQLVFKLPPIPAVGKRHSANVVRATGPIIASQTATGRWRNEEAPQLDYAFIRTDEQNIHTDNTPWKGLRIARIHAIFELPKHYPFSPDEPLAYIEWFTPLRLPDNITGFHHISPSTRRRNGVERAYAEIISVSRIVRSAMLIPISGGTSVRPQFLVNSHIDKHLFCMFKLHASNCLPT